MPWFSASLVVVWQHFLEARELVVLEAGADVDAWHTAVGLPIGVRQRVREDMLNYAKIMIDREWPMMRLGGFDTGAAAVAMDAIDATGALVPGNMLSRIVHNGPFTFPMVRSPVVCG